MDKQEYIDSGILELYVFGRLDEAEFNAVTKMAENDEDIKNEIISIEKAVINFSESVSPFLSSENYEKIRQALMLKHGVVDIKPKSNIFLYLGWAASILLLIGIGYQYKQLDDKETTIVNVETEKSKLQESVVDLQLKNKESENVLAIVRDNNNAVIALAGQEVSPESFAKAYWNKNTKAVHIDASGLPEPPEGMVYQVWALKLNPLTPTSIGLLDNFKGNSKKVFTVENANEAEAFGITLEPAGGSASPTLEQLYTLGKA
ncbi:anti-sigma factor [uncultured Flavobacterium sp.]|uniref:anti-sigma factor n=1 Tax=uncultured Flavobacterium sp. TaxID=165435 RepID=UPI0025F31EB1|nr:anti-sigma factor [uncultured Flavobacterium sp.]